MSAAAMQNSTELIDRILERFHATHRRELQEILRLARLIEMAGGPADLTEQLKGMGNALEEHMFKEEMRLFPMTEQGGNSLIGHLIDDMHAEHLSHRDEISRIESLLSSVSPPAGAEAELKALRNAVAKLFDDLAQHIDVEDEVLFPMFLPQVRS
jgi:regulator of cell morphogenesis and NO signaling